jgi:hypothetical protein
MRATAAAIVVLAASSIVLAQPSPPAATDRCGEVVTIQTHGRTTTRYALALPAASSPPGGRVALVLLPGGGGHHGEGFVTALVDAPSDHPGEDGLAGFRIAPEHAEDVGKVIADVRGRASAAVWLVGTSRGAISAANAAARLSGPAAPDGLVLTSAVMAAGPGGQRPWVTQTVFDLPLERIVMPVLVVGHAADTCIRSPASLMARITARTGGAREQVVTVTGGPVASTAAPSISACQGRTPHGFVNQEAEVAAGMARFIRGASY